MDTQMDEDFWAGEELKNYVKRRDITINIVEYFNKHNDYYDHMFDRVSCGLNGKQNFVAH